MADSSQDDSRERDAILAAVCVAFLLTAGEVTSMAAAVYTAAVGACVAVYEAAAASAGVSVPSGWEPPDDMLSSMADDSHSSAQGIAETYDQDLKTAAEAKATATGSGDARPKGRYVASYASDGIVIYEREDESEARRENEARMARTLRALLGFGGNEFSPLGFGGDPWRR